MPTGPMPEVERGLCVVCQDQEATLAVVDCGCVDRDFIDPRLTLRYQVISRCVLVSVHCRFGSALIMEPVCSDLIMATSQECPLCRTRIVTPYVDLPSSTFNR